MKNLELRQKDFLPILVLFSIFREKRTQHGRNQGSGLRGKTRQPN